VLLSLHLCIGTHWHHDFVHSHLMCMPLCIHSALHTSSSCGPVVLLHIKGLCKGAVQCRSLLLRRLPCLAWLDGKHLPPAARQTASSGLLHASLLRACCHTSLQSPWLATPGACGASCCQSHFAVSHGTHTVFVP